MTTVKELIAHLQTLPQDVVIFTSTDDEGNSYRHVEPNWVDVCGYAEVDGKIEIGKLELTQEERNKGWTDEDIKPIPCVVIK